MRTRVVMVGAGYFAQFHLEGWVAAGAPVHALCDTQIERAQTLASRFGIAHVFSDCNVMFEHMSPELIDVVVPPAQQKAVVEAALARRVATICQKPFAASYSEALALNQNAQQARVPLVVHENFRFTPWFRECRRLIDQGWFGRLYSISFRLRPGDGQGDNAYLDRQPYFQKMPRLLVRETAVHFIDTFRYLFGEVCAVTARLRRLNRVIAGEDAGLIIFEFADQRVGLFDGNRLNDHSASNTRRTLGECWIEGERGVLRLDGNARLWWKPHGRNESEHVYPRGSESTFGSACWSLQAHVLDHLREGKPLENSSADYLVNRAVEEAVYASHNRQQRITMSEFDPLTEESEPLKL